MANRLPLNGRSSLLRHVNSRTILAVLQQRGSLSRAEIARQTGISVATVTRAVSELLDAQLIEEGEYQATQVGRPGKFIRLARTNISVIGVVVGVRHCEIISAGLDGQIHPHSIRIFETPQRYPDLVAKIVQQVQEYAASSPTTLVGVGVSIPGLLHRGQKRTLVSPNLHQTDGQQLGNDLQDQLDLDIVLLQESHALCLAEQTYGAARGVDNFAMVDLTDGLGLGVVIGGSYLEGQNGLAGELGHITVQLNGKPCGCGNRGCLETLATDAALIHDVAERLGKSVSIDDLMTLTRSQEVNIDAELSQVIEYLGVGLSAVINLFNPQKVFVYGHFFDLHPDVFSRVIQATQKRSLSPALSECEIIRAKGNKQLGALAGIIHQLTLGRVPIA